MAIREHTIYDCILRNACNHSYKTALVSGDLFLTFADVPIHVNSLARGLLNTGYEKGDRIAVLLNNCAEYALLLAACTRIGVIAVCLNTRTSADEMRMVLESTKPKALESPPIYPRQLILMIKQISAGQNYLFIQNLSSPHSLFNWYSKNTSLKSKILKFAQQTFNTLNCKLST